MTTLNEQINAIQLKHATAATAEVMALCRYVAASAFNIGVDATAASATAPSRKPRAKKTEANAEANAEAKPKAKKAATAKSAKRSPEEFESLKNEVLGDLKANPGGVGIEAIAKSLKRPSKELTLPIKKLLAEKAIQAQGQKRATKYFPKT